MVTKRTVLLIGGSDAGKSNFLFRLWLAIKGNSGLLTTGGLPDDVEYLRTGADELLRGKFAPHTPVEVHNRCVIPVASLKTDGQTGQLIVPDCSGEKWQNIYMKREWSQEWEDLIHSETGCLLFVRATSDNNVAPLDWISYFDQFGSVHNPNPTSELQDEAVGSQSEQPKPVIPTQVMLIEWLQFLRKAFTDHAGGMFRPKIGVVVSAWDAVPEAERSDGPRAYLVSNFPMFEQFLQANGHSFDVQIFGVTVVGGDLENEPGFRESYFANNPSSAGYVVHALEGEWTSSPDHTLPVAWALGLVAESEPER